MSEVIAKKDTGVKIRIWDVSLRAFDVEEASLSCDLLLNHSQAQVHFIGPEGSAIEAQLCEWYVSLKRVTPGFNYGYILSWPQKETIIHGTCHFVDLNHAIAYYLPYCENKGNGRQQRLATKIMVGEKLKAGEIHLGEPPLNRSQTCYVDSEGRYFIREAK